MLHAHQPAAARHRQPRDRGDRRADDPTGSRGPARIVGAASARFSALAIVGAAGSLIVVLVAVFGPLAAPYDPNAANFGLVLAPPLSPHHLLGTDQLGRDVLSRMLYGARTTLEAGIVSTLLGTAVGLPYGMLAGYFRGPVDMVLMRVVDVMLAFPFLLLAVGLAAISPPTLWTAVLALGVAQVPQIARIARGATLEVRDLEYVQAALVNGERDLTILRRQILPNVLRPSPCRPPSPSRPRSSARRSCPSSASASSRPPRTGARCSPRRSSTLPGGLARGLPRRRDLPHRALLQPAR